MSCKYNNQCGKVCDHFVVTTAVTFADGTLTLTLPDDVTYGDGNHFCIVIGQTIPAETTINAPVVAVIGTGATEFPLLTRCGDPVVSQQVDVRRKYKTRVRTTAIGGSFTVLQDLPCANINRLGALNDAEGGA